MYIYVNVYIYIYIYTCIYIYTYIYIYTCGASRKRDDVFLLGMVATMFHEKIHPSINTSMRILSYLTWFIPIVLLVGEGSCVWGRGLVGGMHREVYGARRIGARGARGARCWKLQTIVFEPRRADTERQTNTFDKFASKFEDKYLKRVDGSIRAARV